MKLIPTPNNAQQNSKCSLTEVFGRYDSSFYRSDIQGIRAISALLIMIYHIWIGRVSGGVDVFFVISGFLVTTTLLKSLARSGKIEPIKFLSKVFRRILPSAFVVLFLTFAFTLVFIPGPLWKYAITEFIASAAQIENLELIRIGTDYLAREAPPSQFQQFWALSIQMQFYIALLIVCAALAILSKAAKSTRPFTFGLSVIMVLSFAYSIWKTHHDPTGAYFHPLARFWEFLAGSLIAANYPRISRLTSASGRRIWTLLCFAALLLLTFMGVFAGNGSFPGWIALLPVVCASILIIGGKANAEENRIASFLSNPKLVYLGSFSFLIYLWHWPILVFAHYQLGHTNLGLFDGIAVIAIAILLAAVTKRMVEDPLTKLPIIRPRKQFIVFLSLILAFSLVGAGLRQGIVYLANSPENGSSSVIRKPLSIQESVEISLTKFISIDLDRPHGINCLTRDCTGGDTSADRTLVMVGASHSAQWFDIIDKFGRENGYKVVTRFNNDNIVQIANDTGASVVFMNSTRTSPESVNQPERLFIDDPATWKTLLERDLDVVTIRDNPRFGFFQNACVWENQDEAQRCAVEESQIFAKIDPTEKLDEEFENFHAIDLSEMFCVGGLCPAVHDDILMYYDKHHISKTYSDYIARDVIDQVELSLTASKVAIATKQS